MKKRLIRMIGMFLSVIVIVLSVLAVASATENNSITANVGPVKAGEIVEIPVCISNNTGLMGIALHFSYDELIMEPVSTNKGSVIETGLFDDSIATSNNNEFKVIWCGANEVTSDGDICLLKFKIRDSALSGTYKISVSYDKQNTFDEKYEAVNLNCEDIVISVENDGYKNEEELSIWQKIVKFFEDVWAWIVGLFV